MKINNVSEPQMTRIGVVARDTKIVFHLGGHFKTAHPWAVQNRTLGLVMCRRVWLLGRRALPGPGG